IDTVTPTFGLAGIYMAASIRRHVASERRQRWIREAFSPYLSPNLVEHLIAHPGELQLSGRRQACSFVFTDLCDFTRLVEQSEPEAIVGLLNEYLEEVVRPAFHHEGTLVRNVCVAVAVLLLA